MWTCELIEHISAHSDPTQTSCRGAEGGPLSGTIYSFNWYFISISYNSMKIQTSYRGAEGLFTAVIDISTAVDYLPMLSPILLLSPH